MSTSDFSQDALTLIDQIEHLLIRLGYELTETNVSPERASDLILGLLADVAGALAPDEMKIQQIRGLAAECAATILDSYSISHSGVAVFNEGSAPRPPTFH